MTPPRRARTGAAIACAVLPAVVVTHATLEMGRSPVVTFAALAEIATAGLGSEARHEGDVRRAEGLAVFAPSLTTNAEREREWGDPRGAPGAPTMRSAAAVPPVSPTQRRMARGFLARARDAIARGDLGVAREALFLYDNGIRGNPFPAERSTIAAMLSAGATR